ncbi:BirA family transcriptional regulator, biotin operon repressor / biotin-[acetyl-CoA-carboxylase] ligase [Brevibacterium siliguriense]|uniref:BirA family transcriptional regulator, biotin operon repressor / biotin-[acetyl-CoA-carboxylase] ligase n=1 Tax=Brevibacterium siliguriense TaxID=1136497 RepID=A0A1H1VWK1_9MICO|nr:biotin--[acetyl-CoA-carboxylase] ligase [Brevibacterium siliguriense]SDS89274.1 BirA family transcriptional regulator, biotin operon repressor / biotin-[acetyl-CoA-carboxylase] ligase [Brevibacterium siliguriense]
MNSQHNSLLVDVDSVRRTIADRGLTLPPLIWDDSCASTNDELARSVREGAVSGSPVPEFTIRGTDFQNAGHGRLGRTWTVPARRSLTWSILLTPPAGFSQWGWIPLIAGEAVHFAVAEAGVPAAIKWPNDVLTADGKKLCGILARVEPFAGGAQIVLGMGLNTRLEPADLPREDASSLAIETGVDGSEIDHEALLVSILSTLIPCYGELIDYGDEDFRDSRTAQRVREHMVTLGSRVRVEKPDGTDIIGTATGLDSGADLIIDDRVSLSAGDVHHLRPVASPTVPERSDR